MSTHQVEVVPVKLEKHPNADSLSIVRVHGFSVCVRSADWQDGELGAYIPPDSVVPATEPFAFLGDKRRIRVKKLRGVVSMGLIVKAPSGLVAGDDAMEALGVTHYEPPVNADTSMKAGMEAAPGPSRYAPSYDVENARRYAADIFVEGEPLWITEKIHGASGRWCHDGEKFHCGSRTEWKRESESNLWWKALRAHPDLMRFMENNPDFTVYGEVYGQVQDLKYGVSSGVRIAVFDILRANDWLNPQEARAVGVGLPWVPLISDGVAYNFVELERLAEGRSLIEGADHISEGIVAKPLIERTHPSIGRVQLKVISNAYLERP